MRKENESKTRLWCPLLPPKQLVQYLLSPSHGLALPEGTTKCFRLTFLWTGWERAASSATETRAAQALPSWGGSFLRTQSTNCTPSENSVPEIAASTKGHIQVQLKLGSVWGVQTAAPTYDVVPLQRVSPSHSHGALLSSFVAALAFPAVKTRVFFW